MGEPSEDGGTLQTDCSSIHSNDDTQSSIQSEDLERILSAIPETPNTRKSVTFSFSEPYTKEKSSPFFSRITPLAVTYDPADDDGYTAPSHDGTFDEKEVRIYPGSSANKAEEGREELLPRPSISHRPSILEDISRINNTHYMKVWIIVLLLSITLFASALIFWPTATAPPSFSLIYSRSLTLNISHDPSIHVNGTTQDIRIPIHHHDQYFESLRFSQSLARLPNSPFGITRSQSTKCSVVVDENVLCCKVLESPVCYIKEDGNITKYKISPNLVAAESSEGRVQILKMNQTSSDFFVQNGKNPRRIRVYAGDGHDLKSAFLQNGTVYSVYEHREQCEQIFCDERECSAVRNPKCGELELVFLALPSNSIVFMNCDPNPIRKDGLYKQLTCTLSQLLLPSLAIIAKSAPFQYTRPYNTDSLIAGFGDYIDTNVFHLNQLRLREDSKWEIIVSAYRLLTLS